MVECYVLRIELYCGSNQRGLKGLQDAERRYHKAQKVADHFRVETYFDEHEEHGTVFKDGYIYPTACNIETVLDALEAKGVEFDNIDLPTELEGSELSKRLHERYPLQSGVSVNDGDADDLEPHARCPINIRRRPESAQWRELTRMPRGAVSVRQHRRRR